MLLAMGSGMKWFGNTDQTCPVGSSADSWKKLPLSPDGTGIPAGIQNRKLRPQSSKTVSIKFLIVSTENIGTKLAGPGMRYLEMARALCDDVETTLAMPGDSTLDESGIRLVSYDETRPADFRKLVETHDVALVTAFTLNKFPFLPQINIRFIVDLYDPYIFENFYYYSCR